MIGFLRPSYAAPIVAPKAHVASRAVELLSHWWGSVLAKDVATRQQSATPGDGPRLAIGEAPRKLQVLPLCQGFHCLFCRMRIATVCVAPTLCIPDRGRDGHLDMQCSSCNPSCRYERLHARSSLPQTSVHGFGHKLCAVRRGSRPDHNALHRLEGLVMTPPVAFPCQHLGTVRAAGMESSDVAWSCLVLLHLYFQSAVRTCLLLYFLAVIRVFAEACPLKAGCDKRSRAVTYCRLSFRGAPLCLVFAFALHCLPGCQAVRTHGLATGLATKPDAGGSADGTSHFCAGWQCAVGGA